MAGARLTGKVALVTGGASGIGRAACARLAEDGAKVLVCDLNAGGAEATAAQIGSAAAAMTMDVSSEEQWITATDRAIELFGKLDVVANIAGIGAGGTIEEFDLDSWHAMVAVNLTGTLLGCKHAIKAIVKSGGAGAIVNMSSIGGLVGPADIVGYNATKGGVTILTKSVALHCAEKRYPIRCVSIHPTYVDSEMLDPVAQGAGVTRAELVAGMGKLVPMGRAATPEDVAAAVAFAASDDAAMISGSALVVDGAQLAGPPSAHF